MQLMIVGCEYAGKTTLAVEVSKWMIQQMGLPFVRWHNHFVVPHVDQHLVVSAPQDNDEFVAPGKRAADLFGEEEKDQILAMRPMLLEHMQRQMIWRHLHQSMGNDDDYLVIGGYYAEAVYAPLYYGYGEPNSFSDRRARARAWDAELRALVPEIVLVLVKASTEVILRRMRLHPRSKCILQERDVQLVLERFEEEYAISRIRHRFSLDTTTSSVPETAAEFVRQMAQHLTEADRLRIISHHAVREHAPSRMEAVPAI